MSPRWRATLALAATLSLGVLLGVLLGGFVHQMREGVLAGARGRGGFVEHVLLIIDPIDEAQRQQLQPLLRAAEDRNHQIIDSAGEQMRTVLQQLLVDLEPLLDEQQLQRLRRFARHPEPGPGRRGGPGRPPRDKTHRPPPPRR